MGDTTPETVEVQADQLQAVLDRVDELEDRVDDLERERDQLREERDQLRDRVADLEDARDYAARERAELSGRVADVEDLAERLEDGDLAEDVPDEDSGPTPIEPDSSLEQLVSLPEPVAEDSLSANEQRARFVAKDVAEYAQKAPAGYVLGAGRIGRVLKAGTDCDAHPETVRRVMRLVEELDDRIELRKQRGEKRLVVQTEAVGRLSQLGAAPHSAVNRSDGGGVSEA